MSPMDSPGQDRAQLVKRALAAATLAASGVFLGYSLYMNWQELRNYSWRFTYSYLLLATAALLLAFVSNVVGWGLIIGRVGGPRDFRKNTEIYCLAAHGKRLPGLVWYVAGRAYLYGHLAVPSSAIVQGSLWEIVLQLLSGLVVYAMLLPLYKEIRYAPVNHFVLSVIPLFLVALSPSVSRRVLRWLTGGQREVELSQVSWRDKALWFAIYSLGWLAGGSTLYFLARAVSFAPVFFLPVCWGAVALSSVASTLLFFLPGGMGAREVSLSLLLSSHIPLPVAIALALLFRVWILVGETILLILFWSLARSRLWDSFDSITQKGY